MTTSKITAKDYEKRVFDLLEAMNYEDQLYIAEKVSPENREKFIATVKLHIETGSGLPDYIIEFNNQYTHLRKIKI